MYRIYIYKIGKINYQLQVRTPTQSTSVHAPIWEPIIVTTQDLDIIEDNSLSWLYSILCYVQGTSRLLTQQRKSSFKLILHLVSISCLQPSHLWSVQTKTNFKDEEKNNNISLYLLVMQLLQLELLQLTF